MFAELLITAAMHFATAVPDTLGAASVYAPANIETAAPTPVRRLGKEELRRSGAAYLSESVRLLAGVSVKDYGGIGGLKSVSIRNMGAAHTAVCYDGFTISDAQNGYVDIGRFFTDNISEIMVTIGQDDDIFRSARSYSGAGALHIRSRAPEFTADSKVKAEAAVSAASFNTWNPRIRYEQYLTDTWALTVNASWLSSKGEYPFILRNGTVSTEEIRLNSDVGTINAEMNIYGDLGKDRGRIMAKTYIYTSERGLPGSVVLYTQKPTERLWDRNIIAAARYENIFGMHWKFESSLSYTNSWNRYTDTSALYSKPQDNIYSQQETALSAIVQYSPAPCFRMTLAEDVFANKLDSDIPECPFPRRLSNITALSAQYEGNRLKATASLLGTYITERTLTAVPPAPDRIRLSPSASISYSFPRCNGLLLRASYRDGFRVPTFNDLYYARVGNTALRPEKARQVNIGVTWQTVHGRFRTGVTADAYLNMIQDKISAIPTMFIWKMYNVGKVRMIGTDLTATAGWEATRRLTFHARGNWSYQYAVDITDPAAKNHLHQIPYTPRHTGSVILSAETGRFTATYSLAAVGRRYSSGQNIPANLMDAYADHSISLSGIFHYKDIGLRISLEVLNLTDDNYEVIRHYPMAGRSYRLTLHIHLNPMPSHSN